jgi:hypothetical protein
MPRQTIQIGSRLVHIAPDDPVALARRYWALWSARLVDELSDEPVRVAVALETAETELRPRVAEEGLVGFVGQPIRAFPDLAAQGYDLPVTIHAHGYLPMPARVALGAQPGFPASFVPPPTQTLGLHRGPVTLAGRTVLDTGVAHTPLANVSVSLTRVWWTLAGAPLAANVVSLQPGLYFSQPVPGAQVRRREIPPAGPPKRLLRPVPPGAAWIDVSDQVGIAFPDVIALDFADTDREEMLVVADVQGASTPDQPARVRLAFPNRYSHAAGAVVRRMDTTGPAGAGNVMQRAGIPGDPSVFLDGLAVLAPVPGPDTVLEVLGGGSPLEYHRARPLSAVSDGDGYFRLPPLSRVAQVEVEADRGGGFPVLRQLVSVDYERAPRQVEFVFR